MQKNPKVCVYCYLKRVVADPPKNQAEGALQMVSIEHILKKVGYEMNEDGSIGKAKVSQGAEEKGWSWSVSVCPIDHGTILCNDPVPDECIYRTEHAVNQE